MLLIHHSQSQVVNILNIRNCGSGEEVALTNQDVRNKATLVKVILSKKTFVFGVPEDLGFSYGESSSMKPTFQKKFF